MGGNQRDGVAQWIERLPAEEKVGGSTPLTVAFVFLVSKKAIECISHLIPGLLNGFKSNDLFKVYNFGIPLVALL